MTAGLDVETAGEVPVGEVVSALRNAGFQVLPLPNLLGVVDGFHASRFCGDYVDSVIVRGAEFAHAARVRNDFRPDDPFHEPDVLWFEIGDLYEVLVALHGLYRPRTDPVPSSWPHSSGHHRLPDGVQP